MTKKKQAMMIVSIAVASFLVGTMFNVNLLTVAKDEDEGRPVWMMYVTGVNASALPDVWRVNATNLAFDEEGNLRVIQMNGEQNVTIKNLPLDEQGNLKVKIIDEKPVQTYTDAVEIDVFGWVTRQYSSAYESREWGIFVERDFPAELAFIFSPRQSSFNITNLVIVIYATNGIDYFTLSINDVAVYYASEIGFTCDVPSTRLIELDPSLVQINEGINSLRMSSTGSSWLSVYRVSLFIEYEYQA